MEGMRSADLLCVLNCVVLDDSLVNKMVMCELDDNI